MIRFLLLLAVTVMCGNPCSGWQDPPTDSVSASGSCQTGWREFKGQCYSFNREPSTWTAAASYCNSVGARLVEIDNAEENQWLSSQIAPLNLGEAYIGLNRRNMHEWIWEPRGNTPKYTNWNGGEPNGGEKSECAVIQNSGGWNDVSCSFQKPYICEKKNV